MKKRSYERGVETGRRGRKGRRSGDVAEEGEEEAYMRQPNMLLQRENFKKKMFSLAI